MSALQQFQYLPAAAGPEVTITVSGRTVTASAAIDGATTWLWNFGDGTTSTLRVPPPKTYPGFGPYTITLKTTYVTPDGCRQYDALTVRTVTQPPSVTGFHAPLLTNDQDIISPAATAVSYGSPVYVDGWCRMSGDVQTILWQGASAPAVNSKLSADAYTGKVTYKCRVRKGIGTTGTTTVRFFVIVNTFGYSGFMLGSGGVVYFTDYRLFPPSPLLAGYSGVVPSGADSVYELRYPAGGNFLEFYVDDVLVYTSVFPARMVGNGITLSSPDVRMNHLEFKDCMMIIGG